MIGKQHPPTTFFRFKVYQDKTTKVHFLFLAFPQTKIQVFLYAKKVIKLKEELRFEN